MQRRRMVGKEHRFNDLISLTWGIMLKISCKKCDFSCVCIRLFTMRESRPIHNLHGCNIKYCTPESTFIFYNSPTSDKYCINHHSIYSFFLFHFLFFIFIIICIELLKTTLVGDKTKTVSQNRNSMMRIEIKTKTRITNV